MAYTTHASAPAVSLASVTAGDSIRVRGFLYDQLSSDCALIGLRVGDEVKCTSNSSAHFNLESDSGPRVLVHRDWARWIEVERLRR
jgi:hypothetical protein